MKTILTILSLMVVLAGCANYRAIGTLPMDAREKGFRTETDGVVVRALPVFTKDDAKKYFDENLLSDRVLAIFLEVFNKTSNEVRIVSLELRMREITLKPATANEVYKAVKREYVGKAVLWWYFGAGIGSPISVFHTYRVNKKIEKDIGKKQFSKEMGPFGTSAGFIWFKLPDKISSKDGGKSFPKGMVLNISLGEEKKLIELPIS